MSKREECRNCGAKLKHDKTSDQYDPEYCSGKCRRDDGSDPYIKTAEEQSMVVEAVQKTIPATLKDYKKNVGAKYTLRADPEKLNWGVKLSEEQLVQGGFRANREPIPGDWDYQEPKPGDKRVNADGETETYMKIEPSPKQANEWNAVRAKAKELGIATHGKKRDVLEAEIKEATNES